MVISSLIQEIQILQEKIPLKHRTSHQKFRPFEEKRPPELKLVKLEPLLRLRKSEQPEELKPDRPPVSKLNEDGLEFRLLRGDRLARFRYEGLSKLNVEWSLWLREQAVFGLKQKPVRLSRSNVFDQKSELGSLRSFDGLPSRRRGFCLCYRW
jgi:hypothetical protein